jgi:hypothetical protein
MDIIGDPITATAISGTSFDSRNPGATLRGSFPTVAVFSLALYSLIRAIGWVIGGFAAS